MSIHRAGVPAETLLAVCDAVRAGLGILKAETPQTLAEWAPRNFMLAGESSHQKGAWESWPFQDGIADMMSDDRIEELIVQKSKRVGYTKLLAAFIAYNIAHRRRNQAIWQPTDDDRDSFVRTEVEPVLDVICAVRRLRRKTGVEDDTLKLKRFVGCLLHLLGGKAARAYRRITVAVAMLDEWDGFDQQIEKSGDPGGLARGRLEGAPHPKFVGGSTPRIKGLSHVERGRLEADADMRYVIDCPHCGVEHPLMWGGEKLAHGFKWTRGEPDSVHHVCPHCRGVLTQADYLRGGKPMRGAWVCTKTGLRREDDGRWLDGAGMPCRPPRRVGLHIWAAYSPQRAWSDIVREFLSATAALGRGDMGPMQLFVNETLGETWEVKGDRTEDHVLQQRAEPYPLKTIPVGGLVLTAGVDLQRDRWEISVWAWARGLESWLVDHHVIEGNPASDGDWDELTRYLQGRFVQAWHGGSIGISAISIDSSDQTQTVYNWVRRVSGILPVRAVKGVKETFKPIKNPATPQDINFRGKRIQGGVKLWPVGVHAAKDLLHGQLGLQTPGPGYVHTSAELPKEWFEQLTAEQRIIVRTPRGEEHRWVPLRQRNESLDCRNYALHAAYCLGLHQMSEARWAKTEAAVQPARDLFAVPVVPATPEGASPSQAVAAHHSARRRARYYIR